MSGAMRGLPTLTFALDFWRAGGADPGAFKTTNLLIHAITTCVLAWFFRRLLLTLGASGRRAIWVAAALALAWAMHPLQVSSVLYAVQRLQTLGTLFLVLALQSYLHARQCQIVGQQGRRSMLLSGFWWAVAMNCKEDAVLLPVYTLILELAVLRFSAADERLIKLLRRGYFAVALIGISVYLFLVVPKYWSLEAYPGRDFSTVERLLTQARVLCMYIWQIVLPLPEHMPFYYDWVQPSRGVMDPWTTLVAIFAIMVLLFWAWRLRARQPLFTFGVLVFFSAHFIASNVVGLELAYEHRNHFALIGAVLAVGSLFAHAGSCFRFSGGAKRAACVALLITLGAGTMIRAHDWRSTLSLARASTVAAPQSSRAWVQMCSSLFKAGGEVALGNRLLDEAIQACSSGVEASPDSLNSYALLLVLKTLRGDVSQRDWDLFLDKLSSVRMSWDNSRAPMILTYYVSLGVRLDKQQVLDAVAILSERDRPNSSNLALLGAAVMNDLADSEHALPYFIRAVEVAPLGDPFPWQLGAELRAAGKLDMAEAVERAGLARQREMAGAR
ncbi:MAG: hypothetical protein DI584_08885 [Stenotrophomonas sp.]|nr:MAG: hypothetical protein DI584_08885 [Stenotrophomonas sp.]